MDCCICSFVLGHQALCGSETVATVGHCQDECRGARGLESECPTTHLLLKGKEAGGAAPTAGDLPE